MQQHATSQAKLLPDLDTPSSYADARIPHRKSIELRNLAHNLAVRSRERSLEMTHGAGFRHRIGGGAASVGASRDRVLHEYFERGGGGEAVAWGAPDTAVWGGAIGGGICQHRLHRGVWQIRRSIDPLHDPHLRSRAGCKALTRVRRGADAIDDRRVPSLRDHHRPECRKRLAVTDLCPSGGHCLLEVTEARCLRSLSGGAVGRSPTGVSL
mmetsp:Transcript_23464/g.53368  ORF Transcript_23464/g.53368 Transcript_23464/m.53368 type:complete len:211 (+) Transcript_23464:284-916(+)